MCKHWHLQNFWKSRVCFRSKENEVLWGSLTNRSHEYDAFSNRMVDSYCGRLPIFQSINYTSVDHTVRIPFAPVVRADRKKFTGTSQTAAIKYRMVSHSSSLFDTRMQNNTWDTIGEERDRRLQHGGVPMGVWGGRWMCRQQLWNVYEGSTNLSHSHTTKSVHACRLYHTCRYESRPPLVVVIDTPLNQNDSAPMNSRKKLTGVLLEEKLI